MIRGLFGWIAQPVCVRNTALVGYRCALGRVPVGLPTSTLWPAA
jgi:hypothetical protein